MRRVSALAVQVSDASREQAAHLARVNATLASMEQMTQSTAATAEETAAATESLHTQARDTMDVVVRLDRLVGRGLALGARYSPIRVDAPSEAGEGAAEDPAPADAA